MRQQPYGDAGTSTKAPNRFTSPASLCTQYALPAPSMSALLQLQQAREETLLPVTPQAISVALTLKSH